MTRDELIAAVRRAFQRATAVRTAARGALAGTTGITEKRMFGEAAALAEPHTRPMVMAGRRMGGYIYVDAAGLTGTDTPTDDTALARWLRRAIAHVETLPKKAGPQKKAGPRKPTAKAKRAAKPGSSAKAKAGRAKTRK